MILSCGNVLMNNAISLKNSIGAFLLTCYRKMLSIPWMQKMNNTDILKDLNNEQNWFQNRIMSLKLKYFGSIEGHDDDYGNGSDNDNKEEDDGDNNDQVYFGNKIGGIIMM